VTSYSHNATVLVYGLGPRVSFPVLSFFFPPTGVVSHIDCPGSERYRYTGLVTNRLILHDPVESIDWRGGGIDWISSLQVLW
jgi:hypothetical protein